MGRGIGGLGSGFVDFWSTLPYSEGPGGAVMSRLASRVNFTRIFQPNWILEFADEFFNSGSFFRVLTDHAIWVYMENMMSDGYPCFCVERKKAWEKLRGRHAVKK